MAGYIDVDAAIKAAKEALKKKAEAMDIVAVIRTDLRNAIKLKGAAPEQVKWIEETFPMRERETDPQARAAKLEAQVRELQAKVK